MLMGKEFKGIQKGVGLLSECFDISRRSTDSTCNGGWPKSEHEWL